MPLHPLLPCLLAAGLLGGCAVGPDYVRPTLDLPAAWKEAGPWKPAQPQAADAGHRWWQQFGDPALDALQADAERANQTLRQAEAAYRQAHAATAAARAAFAPTVTLSAADSRGRSRVPGGSPLTGTTLSAEASASWEPDLWGSVRRSVEAAQAGEQASADDLAAARLSVQAELARDELQLRATEALQQLYAQTTAAYARALQLTQSQYRAGVVLHSDVALAESQLAAAQAQAVDLASTRAQLEHAIAILTGRAPGAFSLPPRAITPEQLLAQLPSVPAGLPSELLERRPDIAGAERRAAAANADIGVAQAAYFPRLVLNAGAGGASSSLGTLFGTPGRVWSLGAALAQTVFDGGLRSARRAQAEAAYDASVAQYKQTVLAAMQQVEDNLAVLRILEQESALQQDAVRAAQLAEATALKQYRAGTATYLAVVTAQTLSLTNQRAAVQLVGRRLAAAVALITATGGDWTGATPVATAAQDLSAPR